MFIRPVTKISALADRISLGDVDAPDFRRAQPATKSACSPRHVADATAALCTP